MRVMLSNPEFLGSKYLSLPIDDRLIFRDLGFKSNNVVCE